MILEFDLYFVAVPSLKAKEYYFKIFDIKSAQSLLIAMPRINRLKIQSVFAACYFCNYF